MLEIRQGLTTSYEDIYTKDALAGVHELAPLDDRRHELMRSRIDRRAERARDQRRIAFLDPTTKIAGTSLTAADARAGKFDGSAIPHDLSASGSRARDPPRNRTHRRTRAFATSPMRCCPAPTGGCSTARTRSDSCRRCRSTTSAT